MKYMVNSCSLWFVFVIILCYGPPFFSDLALLDHVCQGKYSWQLAPIHGDLVLHFMGAKIYLFIYLSAHQMCLSGSVILLYIVGLCCGLPFFSEALLYDCCPSP